MAVAQAPLTLRKLEATIAGERARQGRALGELEEIKAKNVEAQAALAAELARLQELSEALARGPSSGVAAALRALFGRGRAQASSRRSVEALLRAQYEASVLRLREASDHVDRLKQAKDDLYAEVDRLNTTIIDASSEERRIAERLAELDAQNDAARRALLTAAGPEVRKIEAEIDRRDREMSDLYVERKLQSSAEDRLSALKGGSAELGRTIGRLQVDMTHYLAAAGAKLDLLAAHIRAVGAAADASVVMLELKTSIDALTESTNQAARFVVDTQSYLRDNVDRMVEELRVFDSQTQRVLAEAAALKTLEDELGEEPK